MGKEFVMVSRDAVVEAVHAARSMGWSLADKLSAVLDKPADQRHADPDEVDRLHAKLATCNDARETLAAQLHASHGKLTERDALLREVIDGKTRTQFDGNLMHRILMALSAGAEPSAPVEIDERAAFENEFAAKGRPLTRADYDPDAYGNAFDDGAWAGWQARAAMEP